MNGHSQLIDLPDQFKVLSLQVQSDQPTVWIELDTSKEKTHAWTFETYGTGFVMPDDPEIFVGTYQINSFVWHVYYRY